MNIEIVTRATALSQGLVRYFTGKPCKHGHVSETYVKTAGCVTCRSLISSRSYKKHQEKERARRKAHYYSNPKDYHRRSRQWEKTHPEKMKESLKKYRQKNRGLVNALNAKRYIGKIKRTPKWAELDAIKEIYIACPPDCHVDHIIPLQGELVSGLHVLGNLQYLPIKENLSKGNKFDPTL